MKPNTTLKLIAAALTVALSPLAHATQVPGVAAQPDSYFYTGKPYDADMGGYTFAARTYDPEINRWTSADPSGFPDGANNNLYSNAPTTNLDPNGFSIESYTRVQVYTLSGYYAWNTTKNTTIEWSFTISKSPDVSGKLATNENVTWQKDTMKIDLISDNGMPSGTGWEQDPDKPRTIVDNEVEKTFSLKGTRIVLPDGTYRWTYRWDVSGHFTITTGYVRDVE